LLTVGAFYLFARAWLGATLAALLATLAFALQPRSFLWLIMGGGVTRGLGLLLAVLTLWQVYELYRRPRPRPLIFAMLCAAGVVLSHLEMAAFTAVSVVVLALFYGRHRAGLGATAMLAVGTMALSAPWWGGLLARHGPGVFLAAIGSGSEPDSWLFLLTLMWVPERWFSLIGALAVVGLLVCLATRQYFLPAWLTALYILTPRGVPNRATLPVALLFVASLAVVLPLLARGAASGPLGDWRQRFADPAVAWALGRRGVRLALLFFVLHATILGAVSARPALGALDAADRAALEWVQAHVPADSAVLVVPAEPFWGLDRLSEWLPALTGRRSVATVQGSEWLPDDEFARRRNASEALYRCAAQDAACLERWVADTGRAFTHVYVPKRASGVSSGPYAVGLRATLARDPRYALLYDGPGASIYERLP
ncbi:MAG TPA: hypothetical protein VKZ60_20535, partial [Chloroflexota bacterium]|nr:hypothetical protein [Chloroflexota bacterium]